MKTYLLSETVYFTTLYTCCCNCCISCYVACTSCYISWISWYVSWTLIINVSTLQSDGFIHWIMYTVYLSILLCKPKGSICSLVKWADTAFWLCAAVYRMRTATDPVVIYPQSPGVHPLLGQCWATVVDAVPALAQHRPCLLWSGTHQKIRPRIPRNTDVDPMLFQCCSNVVETVAQHWTSTDSTYCDYLDKSIYKSENVDPMLV